MKKRDNKFGFSRKKIDELMTKFRIDNDLRPACMAGVHKDLQKMKERIEKDYVDNIFYLDYWEGDCGYFGWDWSKDNGTLASQKYITDGITNRYLEIYALILLSLGYNSYEEMEEKEYGNDN